VRVRQMAKSSLAGAPFFAPCEGWGKDDSLRAVNARKRTYAKTNLSRFRRARTMTLLTCSYSVMNSLSMQSEAECVNDFEDCIESWATFPGQCFV